MYAWRKEGGEYDGLQVEMGWGLEGAGEGEKKNLISTDAPLTFPSMCSLFISPFLLQPLNLCSRNGARKLQVGYGWGHLFFFFRFFPFPISWFAPALVGLTGLFIGELWHNGWAVVIFSQQAVVGGTIIGLDTFSVRKMTGKACVREICWQIPASKKFFYVGTWARG